MSNMKIMISEEVERCLHRKKQEVGRSKNTRYISYVVTAVLKYT